VRRGMILALSCVTENRNMVNQRSSSINSVKNKSVRRRAEKRRGQ
jgi:hypothetical protein